MTKRHLLLVAAGVVALGAGTAQAVPTCTHLGYGAAAGAKPNKLYLYFPTSNDSSWPEFGVGGLITSPAHRFDASELTSYTGTTAALRDAVFDVVTDDYCEFNVQVIATTTAPPTTFPRRNIIAIGSDPTNDGSTTWGQAENVDTGDPTLIDHARVWGGTYQKSAGGAGGALNGANSTLERWARSIGGTTAHEAGHNYGISHTDGLVVGPGEDVLTHHVMAQGSNYSDEQRAGYRRHFSDHEYSLLASNVGLSVQTMWNWDFVNPNAQTARKLRITFLSNQPSLTVSAPYTGSLSPWGAPTVSAPLGTQTYKGTTYNRYQVTWSTGQAWSGGASGQVAGGVGFHVGTGFTGVNYNVPDPIIITQVDLLDAGNAVLALHPRLVGFDSGALDTADGTFALSAINLQAAVLQVSALRIQTFPRQISINAMLRNQRPTDVFGLPLRPLSDTRVPIREGVIKPRSDMPIALAKLSDRRQIVERVTERDCAGFADSLKGPDTRGCRTGYNVSLFPATSLLVTAVVTDPQAKHWDPRKRAYVVGPVSSTMFYQIAGRHPDLNGNGIDDLIDIASGKSRDENKNGVVDEAERGRKPG